MMPDRPDPLALMASLRLEDGRRWGEVAAPFQWRAARAILTPEPGAPRQVFDLRPKGGSKSSDFAGASIVWLLTQAQPGDVGYVAAADLEQARRFLERAAGLIRRTGLGHELEVQSSAIVHRESGATVRAVAADAAGLEGILSPWLMVDELPNWPATRQAKAMWSAVVSSVPKVRGCRLAVIGHAGTTGSVWHKVWERCESSSAWSTFHTPGPLPWMDPDQLEDQRLMLTPSQYARRHLNEWASDEDRLVTADDLRACVGHSGPLPPRPGVRYVVGVDVGLVNDATAIVVAHAEDGGAVPVTPERARLRLVGDDEVRAVRVVVDRLEVLRGSRGSPVQLVEVEELVAEASRSYGGAEVVCDPWQMAGSAQRLRARGVDIEGFTFSSGSVGRLAVTLHRLLRERLLVLPDDEGLLDELARVRLVERTPGVVRLDHDADGHDDRAVAIALAAQQLLQVPPMPEVEVVAYPNVALRGRR